MLQKGRVERAIRYVRESFFAARQWRDLADLNAQAAHWCGDHSTRRPCPEDRELSVAQAFVQERPHLLALPDNPYPTDERVAVKVGKTPYVRFDLNDYTVPPTQVQRILDVVASAKQVRVLDGTTVIASHPRSYDKDQQIEDPAHIEALVARKRQARAHRGVDRLAQAAPSSPRLLTAAAERGEPLGSLTAALLRLLDRYGAAQLEAAINEALERGVPHSNAVRLSLERRREALNQPPPLALTLPDDPRLREAVVRPHALGSYDELDQENDDEHND